MKFARCDLNVRQDVHKIYSRCEQIEGQAWASADMMLVNVRKIFASDVGQVHFAYCEEGKMWRRREKEVKKILKKICEEDIKPDVKKMWRRQNVKKILNQMWKRCEDVKKAKCEEDIKPDVEKMWKKKIWTRCEKEVKKILKKICKEDIKPDVKNMWRRQNVKKILNQMWKRCGWKRYGPDVKKMQTRCKVDRNYAETAKNIIKKGIKYI